jgi:hypothetical protein
MGARGVAGAPSVEDRPSVARGCDCDGEGVPCANALLAIVIIKPAAAIAVDRMVVLREFRGI